MPFVVRIKIDGEGATIGAEYTEWTGEAKVIDGKNLKE